MTRTCRWLAWTLWARYEIRQRAKARWKELVEAK